MVHIYLLPADEGDFIWIRYGSKGDFANVLVDGGTKNSGREYAEIIEYIESCGEKIEAIVLTHIDYDHLQGAVEGISRVEADVLQKTVKRIYFNTCRGVAREQRENIEKNDYAETQIKGSKFTGGYGIGDAISFMELIHEKGIEDRMVDYVISGTDDVWGKGAKVFFISPGKEELTLFLNQWEPYCKDNESVLYTANIFGEQEDLAELMKESLRSDSSINNGASIAMIFEYEDIKIALLGDAKAAACIRGLKKLNLKMPYDVDAFKLSHHGSRYNASDALLKKLKSKIYLLSTNGNKHMFPNKVTVAHLLKNAKEKEIQLVCNYDWWQTVYQGKYFTKNDNKTYIETNKLQLLLLDEKGIEVKDGLKIYGEW